MATTKKTTTKKTTVRTRTTRVTERKSMVGFGEAVRNFWRGYFDFFGRSTRSEFWFAFLFVILAEMLIAAVVRNAMIFQAAGIIFFIPMMALMTRRFRDAGLSVWWYLIPCLICYGLPVFRIARWGRMVTQFGYAPSDMVWYSLFGVAFMLFCLVVVCLPSKK